MGKLTGRNTRRIWKCLCTFLGVCRCVSAWIFQRPHTGWWRPSITRTRTRCSAGWGLVELDRLGMEEKGSNKTKIGRLSTHTTFHMWRTQKVWWLWTSKFVWKALNQYFNFPVSWKLKPNWTVERHSDIRTSRYLLLYSALKKALDKKNTVNY